MCYCVEFNPICVEKYCKIAVDSVLKAKEHAASNLFDSLISNKIGEFDSLMLDTASVKYWYEFFDKSLDKVLAIHVGIFSALVTFAVAMILIKYWFDHSKFEDKIKEIKEKSEKEIEIIRNELAVVKQVADEVEDAKNNMEELLNKYNGDMITYNASIANDVKNVECKMKIFFEFKKIQNGFSLNQFEYFLLFIHNYLENANDNQRDDLLLWMITEKVWLFIGQSLNSNYLKSYKKVFHDIAFDFKVYTDAFSKRYPGSDLSDFEGLNTFCKSFGTEMKDLFKA